MHHTKYVVNHEFGAGPEKVHRMDCPQVAELSRYAPRGGVVHSEDQEEMRMRPLLLYSDFYDALIEQGFTPCDECNPSAED